ncbi:uncharacterized protein ARMOST_17121 [Armillaria ostoyae]|uniref:Uncharacterized protein n=1 Tax=Armillaria ostoyae TaxID=47428 RepID=A0A284RY41_ARMOS|nr:uncharacterized protein ARMOST_17121 [Armillaria ostoyae]
MGDAQLWGAWGDWVERGRPMLVFGGVGSGGREKCHMAMIPSTFIAPSGLPSMLKSACTSSLSFGIGILTFIPPSRSTSPALLKPPSLLSFWVSPPQNSARAPPHSINPPAPVVAVIVVLGVGILIVGSALRGPSRAEMTTDIESPDVWHTLVACGIRVQQRLAPMSMWGVQGRRDCEFGSFSWPLAGVGERNRCRRVRWSPGQLFETSSSGAASFKGLREWWGQDRRNPGLLGPPDALKRPKIK